MFVLDTSALFSMDQLPPGGSSCPPGVIAELKKYKDPRLNIWEGLLNVAECSEDSLEKVKRAATDTGDIGRLSPVDLTVLALSLDLNAVLLTDDYSIQNTARKLGIEYRNVGLPGITKTEKWNYRCVGCGKWYKEKLPECPICGSPMKSFRKRRIRSKVSCSVSVFPFFSFPKSS